MTKYYLSELKSLVAYMQVMLDTADMTYPGNQVHMLEYQDNYRYSLNCYLCPLNDE